MFAIREDLFDRPSDQRTIHRGRFLPPGERRSSRRHHDLAELDRRADQRDPENDRLARSDRQGRRRTRHRYGANFDE